MRKTRGVRSRERGAAIVEFALILPLLSMMALGMLTAGIALDHKQEITNASREAARFGSTVAQSECNVPANCSGFTWAQLVQAIAVERSNGAVASGAVCVALVEGPGYAPTPVTSTHTTMTDGSACFVDNSTDTGKRVQVRITKSERMQAVLFNMNLNLGSRAIAQFEDTSA
jgi:Flp pilus assembly protein TadG